MTLKLLAYPPKTGVQSYSSVTSTDGYHWRIQGGVRDACLPWDPNSFIFMQFSEKKLQNNRLAHPLWELASPSRKSWIRHCLFVYLILLRLCRVRTLDELDCFALAMQHLEENTTMDELCVPFYQEVNNAFDRSGGVGVVQETRVLQSVHFFSI